MSKQINAQLLAALKSLYGAVDSCVDLTPDVMSLARAAIATAEAHDHIVAADNMAQQAEPVAWVRFCSDGCYEGPIMNSDSRMDGARRASGAWTPLYAQPPAVAVAVPDGIATLLSELAAYAPASGSLCAPTALQGFAIRAAAMLAAAPQQAVPLAVASLRVGLDGDNDVYVSIADEDGSGSVEFCVPGSGGGKSPRTRAALISLMVAMEADNAETPSRDWWKARDGAAQKGGAQ